MDIKLNYVLNLYLLIVLDNLKESANRIVKQQLNPVGKSDDSSDIMSMDVSDECPACTATMK